MSARDNTTKSACKAWSEQARPCERRGSACRAPCQMAAGTASCRGDVPRRPTFRAGAALIHNVRLHGDRPSGPQLERGRAGLNEFFVFASENRYTFLAIASTPAAMAGAA